MYITIVTITLSASASLSVCKFSLLYPLKVSCMLVRIKQIIIHSNLSKMENNSLNIFARKLKIQFRKIQQ